jgi:hypothetical protein
MEFYHLRFKNCGHGSLLKQNSHLCFTLHFSVSSYVCVDLSDGIVSFWMKILGLESFFIAKNSQLFLCSIRAIQNTTIKMSSERSNGLLFSCGRPRQTTDLKELIKFSKIAFFFVSVAF